MLDALLLSMLVYSVQILLWLHIYLKKPCVKILKGVFQLELKGIATDFFFLRSSSDYTLQAILTLHANSLGYFVVQDIHIRFLLMCIDSNGTCIYDMHVLVSLVGSDYKGVHFIGKSLYQASLWSMKTWLYRVDLWLNSQSSKDVVI